ncbi:MAG: cyclic pyranopterin monophosphate synthase MoaC [Candidatus Omnitrophota bacterium]
MTKKKINHQKLGMVDVSHKPITKRIAIASATIAMSKVTFMALMKNRSPKGNVLEAAKIAGIMAAKKTPDIIPLCHPLEIQKVNVEFELSRLDCSVLAKATVICLGRTGVEMEALTAATVAVLTIYDMMKWSDRTMVIKDIILLHKNGGKSGSYNRKKKQ